MTTNYTSKAKELVQTLSSAKSDSHKALLNESLNWVGRAEAAEAEAMHYSVAASNSK